MAKRYDEEFRARAVRLVSDHIGEYDTWWICIAAVATRSGVSAETLRRRINQAGLATLLS